MSLKNKPQPLGKVLNEWIEKMGLRGKIDETRAIEAWAEMAGPQINGVTRRVWMKQGKLYVQITSAPWRQELHLNRRQWCYQLNERLQGRVVEEIVFR